MLPTSIFRKSHFAAALLMSTSLLAATPALAVSDAEFEALKSQMSVFAGQLEKLQKEQVTLRGENAALKTENVSLREENEKLAEKIEVSMSEISKVKASAIVSNVASIEPAAGAEKGMLIPGSNTRLKLGGYIKADAIHDFGVSRDGNGEDFGLYAAIPLSNSADDDKGSNTRLHARQTRINLTATTPTSYGDLKMFLEGDFMDSQGSQTTTNRASFGLRHAYGELGSFLIGSTWSNFMDLAAYPESLDFIGVAGNSLVRQGQIRYTYKPEGSKNSYSLSIENPNSEFLEDAANTGTRTGVEEFPDIIAKARFVGDDGELSLKAVGRKLEAYDTTGNAGDSEYGYVVGASGKWNVFEKDDIRFQVAYGDGMGRYLFDLAATGQGAGYTNNNRRALETIEAWGGYAAYRHHWNDSWRSNFMVGGTHVLDNPSFLSAASTNEDIYSANVNLIWAVTDKVDVGGEYIYGHRETEDGSEGTLHRAQFSAKYKF
jgi:hypothetical protein